MAATRVKLRIDAARATVYRALLDRRAVQAWIVPDGMSSQVHEFDAREGGAFRISLTYEDPDEIGKTSGRTDTYHGRFTKLVENEQGWRMSLRKLAELVESETVEPFPPNGDDHETA